MSIRTIKTALARLNREGGEAAAKKLILAVPYKRGAAPERDEIIAMIAKDRGEAVAEVKTMLRGSAPGVLIRAEDYNSHPAEANLAMIADGTYEHAGEIVYPRPEDLRWSEAQIIDDNGELYALDRWEEAVAGILYGSDGRRGGMWGGMYFTPARRAANGRGGMYFAR